LAIAKVKKLNTIDTQLHLVEDIHKNLAIEGISVG